MSGQVEFHTGVPDTLDFACRLLRKAHRQGASVLCLAPGPLLEDLDRTLWTFAEREFVPHARLAGSTERVLRHSPIWLAANWEQAEVPRDVLLSLAGVRPAPVTAVTTTGRAPRVIEVVGNADDEVERGRGLWRLYKAAGAAIVHHPFGGGRD